MLRTLKLLTLLIAVTFLSFSCTESEMENGVDQQTLITSGNWNILLFFDEQGDKARDFANYSFEFKKDGIVTATKGTHSSNGSWYIDSSSDNVKRLVLDFSDTPFNNLNNRWNIKEITTQEMELIKSSLDSENLVFVK